MEVLNVQRLDRHEVKTIKYTGPEYGLPDGEECIVENAYNLEGQFIGSPGVAETMLSFGVYPQYRKPDSNVCTIGFCEREQRWYGWSHRGLCSFGIGDKLFDPAFGDETTHFQDRGEITIETLAQARQAAERFAEYIS